MPYVSVIIPCFNCAKYLPKCFDALARQTYKSFDVICVDDCSNDETTSVIKQQINRGILKISLLRNEHNSGPAYSRNRAIVESKSEFVCFCDSDDWYDEDYLQKMIDSQRNKNSDVVICGHKLVMEDGRTIKHLNDLSQTQLSDKKEILLSGVDSLCVLMVRRSIISTIPIPNVRNGEDMGLLPLLISSAERFSCVPECLYNYYCRESSASKRSSQLVEESLYKSFDFVQTNMPALYKDEVEFLGIRNYIYASLLSIYKEGFDKQAGKNVINKYSLLYPKWSCNKYLNRLPLFKRLFIILASNNFHFIVYLMAKFHKLITA